MENIIFSGETNMQTPHKWGKKEIEEFIFSGRIDIKENETALMEEFMDSFVTCLAKNEIKHCMVDLKEVKDIIDQIVNKKINN